MQQLNLTSEEQDLLKLSDLEVDSLLASGQRGEVAAREDVLAWAYLTAREYYRAKLPLEQDLTLEDAEELATAFFLEFERTFSKVESAPGFTRHVVKQNLHRYLRQKKKLRRREALTAGDELDRHSSHMEEPAPQPWQAWSDEEFEQYQAVLEALTETDETTEKIMQLRTEDPPVKYKEIAQEIGLSETAIRMRVARFYGLVRKRYKKRVT